MNGRFQKGHTPISGWLAFQPMTFICCRIEPVKQLTVKPDTITIPVGGK